jgi:hypothetical protein
MPSTRSVTSPTSWLGAPVGTLEHARTGQNGFVSTILEYIASDVLTAPAAITTAVSRLACQLLGAGAR